jgi:hypothetical protein
MATTLDLKKRVLALRGKEKLIAAQALEDNHEIAENLNASQLAQGLKSDGTEANFTYSPFTIATKKGKPGLAGVTDHLTNYNTGESYKGLYFKITGDQVEGGTTTDKEESISDRMDGKAFLLDQDNKEIFIRQHVQKTFMQKIRDIIKL